MKAAARSALGISFALAALFACGGGSGGGSISLEGTWTGAAIDGTWWVDAPGVVLRVVIDENNEITGIDVNGQPQNVTGTTARISGQSRIFEFLLDDQTQGGFILDPALEHAVLLDEFWRFAVLEKGAAGLPLLYQEADIFDNRYAGLLVYLDANMELDDVLNTEVTVFADGSFSGFDSEGYTFTNANNGELDLIDATYGVWAGQYDAFGPGGASSGWVTLMLSPDKAFVGAIICDGGASSPGECGFGAWPEQ